MPFGVGLEDFYRSGFGVDEKYLRVSRFMGYSLDVDAVAPDILFSSCPGLCSPAVLSTSYFPLHNHAGGGWDAMDRWMDEWFRVCSRSRSRSCSRPRSRLIHDTRSGLCVLDRRFLLLLESRLF